MPRRLLIALLSATLAGCGARSDLDVGGIDSPAPAPPTNASPWPMRGHDAANRSRGEAPTIADPVELWSFPVLDETGAVSFASPAIAGDGTLYLQLGNSGTLLAVNPDGTSKWTAHVAPNGASAESSPAVGADGNIYVGAGPQLAALDPSGQVVWTVPTSSDVRGSPVIAPDGTIAFGDDTGHVYSATKEGVLRWSLALPGGPQLVALTPAVASNKRIYVAVDDTLYSIVDNGSTLWTANLEGTAGSTPYPPSIADDGSIIVASGPRIFGFNDQGDEPWVLDVSSFPGGAFQSSAAIGADGTVYVTANVGDPLGGGSVLALGATGELRWTASIQSSASPMGPTIGSDGNVYTTDPVQIVHGDGSVSATGIPVAQVITPIVIGAKGRFYTVFNGALHAFGN